MFHRLISFIRPQWLINLVLKILLLLIFLFPSSFSSSSKTIRFTDLSNSSELMSNLSYHNFLLRQYFLDLFNISHSSLVRSMTYDHHSNKRSSHFSSSSSSSIRSFDSNLRRKRSNGNFIVSSPMFTLQSNHCTRSVDQVQWTFHWSHSLQSLASIELIYHLDQKDLKSLSIPLRLRLKQSSNSLDLLNIETSLEFDSNRDFYSVDIFPYLLQIGEDNVTIESSITGETCQSSQSYFIVSTLSPQQQSATSAKKQVNSSLSFDLRRLVQTKPETSSSSSCQLKTLRIHFEELGLAYLIIRPKEYLFTYCEGSCSSSTLESTQQQSPSSLHTLFRSFVKNKHPHLPSATCAPVQFADDHFLLRQTDGTIELFPIKDIIVKQCACL